MKLWKNRIRKLNWILGAVVFGLGACVAFLLLLGLLFSLLTDGDGHSDDGLRMVIGTVVMFLAVLLLSKLFLICVEREMKIPFSPPTESIIPI